MIKSPYPYFGGKSKIAHEVWSRFDNVKSYIEPFFGSGAVLLSKPNNIKCAETINDINAWLTNFWRSVQNDPDGVARYTDYPVSELDLHARGDWLFYRKESDDWIERFRDDPDFYDIKSAGWWVWGACQWIGRGWGRKGGAKKNVDRQLPSVSYKGKGVNRKCAGSRGEFIQDYISDLAERIRDVRICCGDWKRVCSSKSTTTKLGMTGIFLDPPYSVKDRNKNVYGENDSTALNKEIFDYCMDRQNNPLIRIAVCGYEGEYKFPDTWDVIEWNTGGGYGNQGDKNGRKNSTRERIWFSPNCLNNELF